jgi:hypothetical protein
MVLFQPHKQEEGPENAIQRIQQEPELHGYGTEEVFGPSRTQRFLSNVREQIDWKTVDRLMLKTYPVG